uniref:Mannosyl-oligosaccharide glucosidase n=1 Tax=Panagrolaimus sp. JU765 TaxID=591449 RepID=A0AC34QKB8_9BILA
MRRRIAQGNHRSRPQRLNNGGRQHWIFVGSFFVATVACAALFMIVPLDWDQAPVLSKLPNATIDDAYDPYVWGTYRPQLYFGLQARYPKSPQFGLIWYTVPAIYHNGLRHWCDKGAKDPHFMWTDHDGQSFGNQVIDDNKLKFTTQWYNQGRSFATSIKMTGKINLKMTGKIDRPEPHYAFIFYFHHPDACLLPIYKNDKLVGIEGKSEGYGNFKINFGVTGAEAEMSETSLEGEFDKVNFTEFFKPNLFAAQGSRFTKNEELSDSTGRNLWYILFITKDLATIHFNFTAEGENLGNDFDTVFTQRQKSFQDSFSDKFDLDDNSVYFSTAKTALSNLLGGIGYWNGFSKVQVGKNVQPYGPLNLLSAVPSRPFFPRGFLWDEGFHNLLIKNFNPLLTIDIISSWLDTMDSKGWIPREMILTSEAAEKVPKEFIVQSMHAANPPAIFYLVDSLMRSNAFMSMHSRRLYKFYPRLKQWYLWLRDSQVGPLKGTFRWRGRNETTTFELNPKTLPSGLDDFPRASHPSSEEYHLDLLCWMALSSRVVRHLAELSSDNAFMPEIEADMALYNSFENLNKHHWSEEKKAYFDYGKHSYNVDFELEKVDRVTQISRSRTAKTPPKLHFVDDVFGYVNLFPFLLRLLPEDSEQLKYTLDAIKSQLWTDYGLRSLSPSSRYYMARNTADDPPYWRGQIWINLNYLALSALKHYSNSGYHSQQAKQLYGELRENLMRNIHENYVHTGYFWEHYNDKTGNGGGSRPFTGWTSLIVNIITEKYD